MNGKLFTTADKPRVAPPPPATPAQRAANDLIDELARHNIRLSAQNYCLSTRDVIQRLRIEELEAALDAVLLAVDSAGLGFSTAIIKARAARR